MTFEPEKLYSRLLWELFEALKVENVAGDTRISVDDNGLNSSEPILVTGTVSQTALTADEGEKIVLKAMVILSQSGKGTAYIKRSSDDSVLLPAYFSNFSRASTTGELNLELNEAEDLLIETNNIDSGTETFFGISYYKAVV